MEMQAARVWHNMQNLRAIFAQYQQIEYLQKMRYSLFSPRIAEVNRAKKTLSELSPYRSRKKKGRKKTQKRRPSKTDNSPGQALRNHPSSARQETAYHFNILDSFTNMFYSAAECFSERQNSSSLLLKRQWMPERKIFIRASIRAAYLTGRPSTS